MNSDNELSIFELRKKIAVFISEREWEKFHTPKNLAESISIEAAELLEIFQWVESAESRRYAQRKENRERICEELADVVIYCLNMANTMDIDLSDSVINKIEKNTKKYPKDKFHGKKYAP